MSIEVTYDSTTATVRVAPDYGRPVVFDVRFRTFRRGSGMRYVVGLAGSDGEGFSQHLTFELACQRALARARRYERAYSKPRGVLAA